MGLNERDYMRNPLEHRNRSPARNASIIVAFLAVAVSSGSLARFALQHGWVKSTWFQAPSPWRLGTQTLELPLLITGLAIALWLDRAVARRLSIITATVIGLAATGFMTLTPSGERKLLEWWNEAKLHALWRGQDGERRVQSVMEGKSVIVQPDGTPVRLVNSPAARDPSWSQLREFLRRDRTDRMRYVPGRFVCSSFAEMLHNNAEQAGIRCAFVSLELSTGGHCCNAFHTTDRGLIYIDCTNNLKDVGPDCRDDWVSITPDESYALQAIFDSSGWSTDPMGIVRTAQVVW